MLDPPKNAFKRNYELPMFCKFKLRYFGILIIWNFAKISWGCHFNYDTKDTL